jgi:hypothetical protein
MNFSLAGAAAGYQGFTDEQRRLGDDERRQKAAQRAEQDGAFAEETRGRQRKDWQEQDRVKAADKADAAAVDAQFAARQVDAAADSGQAEKSQAEQMVEQGKMQAEIDKANAVPTSLMGEPGSAAAADPMAGKAPFKLTDAAGVPQPDPNSPKLAPEVAAKVQELRGPAGLPQPRNFNDVLERQAELLRRKAARSDLTPQDYAQQMSFITNARNEGVHEALSAFASGDYEGGVAAFNRIGKNQGAKVVSGTQGTTKINGEDVPTHFVTLANGDGSRVTIDATKAQYQMMDLNTKLAHLDRATQTSMQREHYAGVREDNKAARDQAARDAAAGRALQAQHLRLQQQQFDATTPFGQIAAKEKALGAPLTVDQKANILGVDALPAASRAQLNSLLKEQDQIGQALNKAQAEGSWQPDSPGGKQMMVRSAVLNQQVADLLRPGKRGPAAADPANINGGAGAPAPAPGVQRVPNPVAAPSEPAPSVLPAAAPARPAVSLQAPGGVQAAPVPAASPVAQALGLTSDTALNSLTLDKARGIENAAQALKDAMKVYAAVAQSGDAAATATYQKQMESARDTANALIASTGNRQDAVRAAVGL